MRPLTDDTKTNDVQVVGGIESADFTVNVDARLFDMLVADMYSKKVPSVLREIVSNALDAHAMTPTTKPVEVRLPSAFDHTFSVRDFGAGMSHDFVMKLYTKIGHSEKTGTNVATGMFGMGSKSPFAISDVFEVWVYQDGQRRQYTAYRNEMRIPSLRLMGTFPTDEPNGVCVRVPVKDADVRAFEDALNANAFAYYDKNITFSRKLSGETEEMMESIKRAIVEVVPGMFQLIASGSESRGRSYQGGVYVRQGTAIYPFDPKMLGYNVRTTTRSKVIELLQKGDSAVLFDVPIGTCSVVQSREALSYDARTIDNLEKIYGEKTELAAEKIPTVIGNARTYREAFTNVIATYDEDVRCYLSTWTAARDMVKFGQNRIRRNHQAWLEANNLSPDQHILSENATVVKDKLGPCTMYTMDATANYSGAINGTPTKTDSFTTMWPCVAFVIPHGTKDWERRVLAWVHSKCAFKLKPYEGTLYMLIVRARQTEVPLIVNKLEATDSFCGIMADATELPELPPDQTIVETRIKTKRYGKNAVYVWSNGEWGSEKQEVDFAEPAYYLVRNGSHHDNVTLTPTEMTAFCDHKHWKSVVDPTTTAYGMEAFRETGLRPKAHLSNSNIVEFLKHAKALSLIDDTLPIYRLTVAQAARLADMPDHELAPLVKTAVDSFVGLKDEFQAAALVASFEVEGSYSGGQSFVVDVATRLINKQDVAADRLALAAALVADDTYLLGVAMHAMMQSSGKALPSAAAAKLARGRVILAATRELFVTSPENSVRGTATVAAIGEAAKARFPLLASCRFTSETLPHCAVYVDAVTKAIPPQYSLATVPSVQANALYIRNLINSAVINQQVAA